MNKKGFTLIELIVIIAVLAILVTMGLPRYLGHTQEAKLTKLKHDAKLIQDASERYYMNNNEWPYLKDENNNLVEAGPNGYFEILYKVEPFDDDNEDVIFYEIDFDKLKSYVRIKSDPRYFVAAVGNPDFGITVLDPKSKTTQERITNPSTPQDSLRPPNEDEIVINSAEDLYNIRNNLSGKYILMSDIDLSEYDNWAPIGDYDNQFTGSLDGNGFKITNLKINKTTDYNGLFGATSSGAKLSNIALENVDIKGGTHTGGLVGRNYSSIINSYITGTVIGTRSETGGLVGYNFGSIENSYSTGTVSGTTNTGGLVGISGGTIKNSYSTGTVSGTYHTGGLVGYNSGSITSSYSTGTVSGTTNTGGLVGLSNGTIKNSYSTGAVSGRDYAGGLVGYRYSGSTTNSYWNKETSGQSTSYGGTGKTTTKMKQQASYNNWDFDNIWQIDEGETYPYLRNNPQSPPPK